MSVATDVIFQLLDSFSQDHYDDDEEMDFYYSSLGPAVGSKVQVPGLFSSSLSGLAYFSGQPVVC